MNILTPNFPASYTVRLFFFAVIQWILETRHWHKELNELLPAPATGWDLSLRMFNDVFGRVSLDKSVMQKALAACRTELFIMSRCSFMRLWSLSGVEHQKGTFQPSQPFSFADFSGLLLAQKLAPGLQIKTEAPAAPNLPPGTWDIFVTLWAMFHP